MQVKYYIFDSLCLLWVEYRDAYSTIIKHNTNLLLPINSLVCNMLHVNSWVISHSIMVGGTLIQHQDNTLLVLEDGNYKCTGCNVSTPSTLH